GRHRNRDGQEDRQGHQGDQDESAGRDPGRQSSRIGKAARRSAGGHRVPEERRLRASAAVRKLPRLTRKQSASAIGVGIADAIAGDTSDFAYGNTWTHPSFEYANCAFQHPRSLRSWIRGGVHPTRVVICAVSSPRSLRSIDPRPGSALPFSFSCNDPVDVLRRRAKPVLVSVQQGLLPHVPPAPKFTSTFRPSSSYTQSEKLVELVGSPKSSFAESPCFQDHATWAFDGSTLALIWKRLAPATGDSRQSSAATAGHSLMHAREHPSPSMRLPSSHCSPASSAPSPHVSSTHSSSHPSPGWALPSSHVSPALSVPLPQWAGRSYAQSSLPFCVVVAAKKIREPDLVISPGVDPPRPA